MKPQLEKKITKDHPVDGILYMCRVYKALRKKKLIEEIEELENWRRLKRKEVEALVRESQSKSKKKF